MALMLPQMVAPFCSVRKRRAEERGLKAEKQRWRDEGQKRQTGTDGVFITNSRPELFHLK